MKIVINFTECEHSGDMDMYYGDIQDAGGNPIWDSITIDHDAEEGSIEVEVQDLKAFRTEFKKTHSFHFASLITQNQ